MPTGCLLMSGMLTVSIMVIDIITPDHNVVIVSVLTLGIKEFDKDTETQAHNNTPIHYIHTHTNTMCW